MENNLSLEQFFDVLVQYKVIVIFGYSDKGRMLSQYIRKRLKLAHIYFCDNDKEKQGSKDADMVFSVQETVMRYPDAIYIITSPVFAMEKTEELYQNGIPENNIIASLPEEIRLLYGKRQCVPLTEETFQFEYSVVRHCNLNCKYCDHFCPLVTEDFTNFDKCAQDIKQLAKLFHHKTGQILILGGEPLLNPELPKYIQVTRTEFSSAHIFVVTNGILLEKMDDSFWKACCDYRVGIRVTRYPIKIDYERIAELSKAKGVAYDLFGATKMGERNMWYQPLDPKGLQDIQKSFLLCNEKNHCITLSDGKLYTCHFPAEINSLNHYYDMDFQVQDNDGIDIYKAQSSKEILDFLTRPIPFCRYCDVTHRTYGNKWEISSRNEKEWVS